MSNPAIIVDQLGKRYKLGLRENRRALKHRRLSEALTGLLTAPWRRFKTLSEQTTAESEFWALKDISFEVQPGEVVGIIGRNGAGKSTLLKILSRITEPTEGRAIIRGRVGSLLEVGTGFNPELTGRENIYLNGALLGMRKAEIEAKFDEIVAFAGIDKFLDTPVKRYSSGMYVRLAFAVAAHLEPEILIVDEVLAVGDAEFQRKCLGKMQDVASQGRTVLFVSHNLGAISTLTQRSILLVAGRIDFVGTTCEAVTRYLAAMVAGSPRWQAAGASCNPMQVLSAEIKSPTGACSTTLDTLEDVVLQIEYVVREVVHQAVLAVILHAADGTLLLSTEDTDLNRQLRMERHPGRYRTSVRIPGGWLNKGEYYIRIGCAVPGREVWDNVEALRFRLVDTGDPLIRFHRRGYFLPMLRWSDSEALDAIQTS